MSVLNRAKFKFLMLLVVVLVACASLPALAQDDDVSKVSGVAAELEDDDALLDPNLYVGIQQAYQQTMKLRQPDVMPNELKTLFFTLWQHKLLQEAKRSFRTRRPEDRELDQDAVQENRVRGIRELSLGGILYRATDSWIVWLNGQRVTPEAIPKQVIDLQVSEDYIELKWFDSFTNLIFPIRLRPHQRFNLDSRIFLPGTPM